MKISYCRIQPNYLTRTAIEREQKQFIKIAFAVHLSAVISAERYRSDSGALKSAVPVFVYLCIVLIVHKYRQSAKRKLLLDSPTDRTFENRWSRYKELGKKVPQAYRVYVEDSFLPCDAGGARIFSKEETGLYYYGARYLDPKYSRWLSGDPALNDYMAGSSVGEGGIYNHFNFNLYHYANNNPIRYTDPTGMSIDDWQDNGDGTWTVKSEGATLWDVYGADWKEKSGFDRDPRTLQVGETVGNKNSSTLNEYDASMNGQNDSKNLQHNNSISISSSYYFSRWSYVPVEGIGVNGGASFTGSTFLSDKTLSIFASGFLIAQNLVDDYVFFGDATLFVDGNKVGKSYFQSPNYSFISNGYPFITIGDANFDYDFTNAQSVEVDLHFRAGIAVDSGINKWFINYSKYRMRIK